VRFKDVANRHDQIHLFTTTYAHRIGDMALKWCASSTHIHGGLRWLFIGRG
jgi:hypothetical protein